MFREEMDQEVEEISFKESGFGLENVNKRIKLYYGKQYGLTVESRFLEGTRVTVAIPLIDAPEPTTNEERNP